MLVVLETIARKIAWLPGMGWLDTYVNSLHSRAGVFGQWTGDMQVQAGQYKSLVTDPLGRGSGAAGEEDSDAPGTTVDGSNAAAAGAAGSAQAGGQGPPNSSAANASTTQNRVPPQYRAQRAAVRASCFMFVFLFALVSIVWALFFFDSSHVPWRHSMSWWRIGLQVGLVFLIPIVLHRIIRLWLEGERAPYADIDFAWEYGMRSLQATGVALDSVPLYLLIGSQDEHHELAIQSASHIEHRAAGVPAGPAALHWFIAPDAVYLYASDVGWTSTLARLTTETSKAPQQASEIALPSDAITNAMPIDSTARAGGTIMADQWQQPSDAIPMATAPQQPEHAGEGTLMLGGSGFAPVSDSVTQSDRHRPETTQAIVKLTSSQTSAALERLRYLCQLVRTARGPLCPLNGIVALLPHRLMHAQDDELSELEKAVAADLQSIRRQTQLQVPVTALVTGMENEAGFRELIRRVGPDRTRWQRFGKKFDVETLKTENEIRSFSSHVVGAFEDWIYALFRERSALSKPGNTSLYELLCNVRCSMKSRMERLLVRVFAEDDSAMLFSGLYFAATGASNDRQAFVRGLFDKLNDEQELLQWAPEARSEDRWIRVLRTTGYIILLAGLVGLGYLIAADWIWDRG